MDCASAVETQVVVLPVPCLDEACWVHSWLLQLSCPERLTYIVVLLGESSRSAIWPGTHVSTACLLHGLAQVLLYAAAGSASKICNQPSDFSDVISRNHAFPVAGSCYVPSRSPAANLSLSGTLHPSGT